MVLSLHTLRNQKRKAKRLGRGNASGRGSFCGRGIKGQRARTGGRNGLKLRGFKKILLSLPKYKGNKRRWPPAQIVPLTSLAKNFNDNEQVTPGALWEKKLITTMKQPVKILLNEPLTKFEKKLEIFGCRISGSARKLIEEAGGKIIELVEGEKNKEGN